MSTSTMHILRGMRPGGRGHASVNLGFTDAEGREIPPLPKRVAGLKKGKGSGGGTSGDDTGRENNFRLPSDV